MKIYLAGKITDNDWRNTIVQGLGEYQYNLAIDISQNRPSASLREFRGSISSLRFPVLARSIFDRHDYVGPYYINCGHGNPDHGILNASDHHAEGIVWCCDFDPLSRFGRNNYNGDFYPFNENSAASMVADLCLNSVREADLLFAWIDAADAYGTLIEIGYALGNRIPVFIAYQKDAPIRDMWFALSCAQQVINWYQCVTPADALKIVLESYGEDFFRAYSGGRNQPEDADTRQAAVTTLPVEQSEDFQRGMEYARWLIREAPFEVQRPEGYERAFPAKTIRQAWAAGRLSK